MKSRSRKFNIVAIVGPTATGKSDLAVALAKKFNGEIISADSRQVYKGMNIGSGKITREEMRGIRHYLLDVVSPNTPYSVVKFQKAARKAIADITRRGKLPIIVGGTGFWIDAVLSNQEFPAAGPNPVLRKKLAAWSAERLFKKLQKLDPQRAATIADPKNPVRLIRAIEIASAPKAKQNKPAPSHPSSPLFIGLDLADEKLRTNIAKRLKKRMKQGMAKETNRLHAHGVSWKHLEALGLEYRAMARMLRDGIKPEETERLLNFDIWHYARRQRTWFKRNKEIHWIDAADRKKALTKASTRIKRTL